MSERSEWQVGRSVATARGRGGMVAAKTPEAAAAGVAMLEAGGNAVDAAVATAFAAGVAEPWMNGLGGGGYAVIHGPGVAPSVVAYPMQAPAGVRPEMFPLAGDGADSGLFGWPNVVDNINIHGARSVGVPGTVAGLALLVERFGTRTLAETIAPAIAIAENGLPITWHVTYEVARDVGTLKRYPGSAAIFLDNGNPPVSPEPSTPARLRQVDLANTLGRIASEGPRVFYEGELASEMVNHLAAGGSPMTVDDFANYQATVSPALSVPYGGGLVHTIGGGTGGTTLVQSLRLLHELQTAKLGHNSPEALHRMTQAFRQAFADRFSWLADPSKVEVPLEVLIDAGYAAERARTMAADRHGAVSAGDAVRLGMTHGLGPSIPDYATASSGQMADGSTTHLSVIDGAGMAVSITQTLLSLWGSRVTVPGTGVLMNNGMMWFDPEPGRPNSVSGSKFPLSNMAPLIVERDGAPIASLGSSGGRRIMNCNTQMIANLLDYGLEPAEVVNAPRIDASTTELLASVRLPTETREALAAMGHRVATRDERLFGGDFASPTGVIRTADGTLTGVADAWYFPATARGAGE